jgi:hypothetical protein
VAGTDLLETKTNRASKMALLTIMGKHRRIFPGKSFCLPTSEKMSMRFGPSLAHNLHTLAFTGAPGGVAGHINGDGGGEPPDGSPGDAAIPTPPRVD